jgi:hypothetical protein
MQIKRLHMTQVNIPVAACPCGFMDNISFRINMAPEIRILHTICRLACNQKRG